MGWEWGQDSDEDTAGTGTETSTPLAQPEVTRRGQRGHSQVEAEVLLLLEEIVEDELAQKVGVQGVVDDLGPAELGTRGQRGDVGTPGGHGYGDTRTWWHRNIEMQGHGYGNMET